VGSAREREEAGVYRVSKFLSIGRKVFANAAAAEASRMAALDCMIKASYYSERYSDLLYTFPAPPELRKFVKWLERHRGEGAFYGHVEVVNRQPAGASGPATEYFRRLRGVHGASLYFSYDRVVHRYLTAIAKLEVLLHYGPEEEGTVSELDLSAYVIGDSRLCISVGRLLSKVFDLAIMSNMLKMRVGAMLPPLAGLVVWLARGLKERWGDAAASAAAGLATAVLPVTAAAFHEVWRASRIRARGLKYPAVEEVVEEVRSRALEVYSTIAEKAASGQGPTHRDTTGVKIWEHLSVRDILNGIASPGGMDSFTRYARSKARAYINETIWKAAGLRAASEVLASISEPE